jgi:two-component system LytT family response regulator
MKTLDDRVLLHLDDGRRVPVEIDEVFFLEADKGNTLVRIRNADRMTDVRQFSVLLPLFEDHGFFEIHRGWAVNLRKVREIRPTENGGWELKLDPPVNRILPISRRRLSELWDRFGR